MKAYLSSHRSVVQTNPVEVARERLNGELNGPLEVGDLIIKALKLAMESKAQ